MSSHAVSPGSATTDSSVLPIVPSCKKSDPSSLQLLPASRRSQQQRTTPDPSAVPTATGPCRSSPYSPAFDHRPASFLSPFHLLPMPDHNQNSGLYSAPLSLRTLPMSGSANASWARSVSSHRYLRALSPAETYQHSASAAALLLLPSPLIPKLVNL